MSAADPEKAVGIGCYATTGMPCEATARSAPEDFEVEERIDLSELTDEDGAGRYPLYRVEKKDIDTMHMAGELSEALKSRLSYGGLKDKRSASVQYVTPVSVRSERPARVTRERFTATLVGYLPSPLSRQAVQGNTFHIVLRQCCSEIEERIDEAFRLAQGRKIPNFYGLQRFGTSGAGTHRVGRALVKGDFEGAVRVLLTVQDGTGGESHGEVEEAMSAGKYAEAVRQLPPGKDVERKVALELGRHPGDWKKAIRAIPVNLRRLYVQAFQSEIFNRCISAAVLDGEDIAEYKTGDNWAATSGDGLMISTVRGVRDPSTSSAVPMMQLVGFAYRNYGSRFDSFVEEVMKDEEVSPGMFYVKEMQEVSAEGGFRRTHLALLGPERSVVDDVANLTFTLARGQYATVLLREIVKPGNPATAGLA